MLRIHNISKIYRQGNYEIRALNGISYDFPEKGFVTITGESGCGKTTLLNLMSGMDTATNGEIYIDGKDTREFTQDEWNEYRNTSVGVVFQDFNVFDELSVKENIELPLNICEIKGLKRDELLIDVMEQMGILAIRDQITSTLSGGQKQRVALCRALVKKPRILFADEPTGNLDSENSDIIFELIKKISERTLVIMVTHDRERAERYSDVCIGISDGAISEILYPGNFTSTIETTTDDENSIFSSLGDFYKYIKNELYKVTDEKVINITIKKHLKSKNEENKQEQLEKCKRRLSGKNVAEYSKKILIKRRIRQKLTAASFALGIFLLLCTGAVVFYSEKVVNRLYIDQYKDDTAFELRVLPYLSDGDRYKGVSTTVWFEEYLSQLAGKNNVFYKREYGILSAPGKGYDDGTVQLGKSSDEFHYYLLSDVEFDKRASISGAVSDECEGGIVITDYMAEQLEIGTENIGEYLFLNHSRLKLCGILNTDYKEAIKSLDMKNSADVYTQKSIYSAVYVNSGYAMQEKEYYLHSKLLTRNNNFFAFAPKYYLESEMYFTAYSDENDVVTFGTAPQKKNEVVVPERVARQCGVLSNEGVFTEKSFSICDIHAEEYLHYYDDVLNFYDYVGNSVTVVGVVKSSESSVLFTKEIYEQMVKDYTNLYFYDAIGLVKEAAVKYKNAIVREGYLVVDSNLLYSRSLAEKYDDNALLAVFFMGIISILMAVMMLSQIRYEIKDNYRNIGIFKSMGVSDSDIRRIFIRKPMRVVGASVLIGFGAYVFFCSIMNIANLKEMGYRRYISLITDWQPIVIILTTVYIYGLFLAWLPIKEIGKKAIVRIIKT